MPRRPIVLDAPRGRRGAPAAFFAVGMGVV